MTCEEGYIQKVEAFGVTPNNATEYGPCMLDRASLTCDSVINRVAIKSKMAACVGR